MTMHDHGHSVIYIDGWKRHVVNGPDLDSYGTKHSEKDPSHDRTVTPLDVAKRRFTEAVEVEALEAAIQRHPAGRRRRCPIEGCHHVAAAHTAKGQGCAYCKCDKVYVP